MAVLNPVYVSCKLGLNTLLMNTPTLIQNPHPEADINFPSNFEKGHNSMIEIDKINEPFS